MRPSTPCCTLACTLSLALGASAQLSPPMMIPGDVMPARPAGSQRNADVSRGGEQYLVVWEDTRASLTDSVDDSQEVVDVFAMRYDALGQPIDAAPIVISQAPLGQTDPQVAWNGSQWLVVFGSSTWVPAASSRGIYAVRVAPNGVVLDSPPILINDDPFIDEVDPSVTAAGDDWIVSWHDFSTNGNAQRVLRRVDGSGALLNSSILYNGSGNGAPRDARLAFGGGAAVIVYETIAGVMARRINPTTLSGVGGAVTLATSGQTPDVASDGAGFYVTWVRDEAFDKILGTTFSSAGVVGSPGGDLIAAMNSGFAELRPDVAWDGVHYWVAVDQLATGGDQVEGYRVSPTGQPVGPSPILISSAGAPSGSVMAGGPTAGRLFAVWQRPTGFDDLYGATIDNGVVTEVGALELTPPNQPESDLAGDLQSGYLLVFLSRESGASRVMGLRLDGKGAPITGVPFVIHSNAETLHTPRVAWNGSRWLVVWERWLSVAGGAAVTSYRLVAPDESFPQATQTALSGNWPDVGALGGDFLIAASQLTSLDIRKVWYVTVDGNGIKSAPALIGDNHATIPKVESVGDRWLVSWRHKNAHNSASGTAYMSFVDATGAIVAGPVVVGGSHETFDVSVMGDQFAIVASSDKDIFVNRFDANGAKLPGGFLNVSTGPLKELRPVIGNDGARYLMTWNDYRAHETNSGALGDVFARRCGATGGLFGPELAVAADPERPEASGSAAGDMGVTIVAYQDFVSDGSFCGWRTFLRVLDESEVCQPDLGFQGPGAVALTMCGTGLGTGESSDFVLIGAQPNASALLVLGFMNAPVPLLGGTLLPSDAAVVLAITTDANGERTIAGVPGGATTPFTVYVQALSADATLPGGYAFSNALGLTFQP